LVVFYGCFVFVFFFVYFLLLFFFFFFGFGFGIGFKFGFGYLYLFRWLVWWFWLWIWVCCNFAHSVGASGAFKDEVIFKWLLKQNEANGDLMKSVVDNVCTL
jgi:hypothetical protein